MKNALKKVSNCLVLSAALSLTACNASHAVEQMPQPLPIQNSGFEAGLTGWGVGAEFKDQVSLESAVVHSGAQALEIDATTKNNTPFVTYGAKAVGGSAYEFSVWARVAPGSPAVQAALKMESYSATANNAGLYSFVNLPADGTWKQITVQHQVPADTVRCAFLLRVFGKGAVIFDDASLTMVAHAPDVSVIAPTETVTQPAEEIPLIYQLSLRQPWAGPGLPKISARLQPLDETANAERALVIPAVVKQMADNQHFTASFTAPKLAAQDYTVGFEYQQNGELLHTTFPAYIFTTIARRQPASLTNDGTILWHGKPFFPIGMYHPGDYQVLAENGFNAVQGDAVPDLDAFKTRLDLAQKYGLAVDVPLYNGGQVQKNLSNSIEKAKRFANHPSILAWKIFDEPHISMDGGVAIEIPAAYRALKAADPNHPIELTLNSADTQKFWSNFCDIVQVDSYPLPRFPLTVVSDMAHSATNAMQPWQNLSLVLQCGWVPDLSNQPSVAQARSMVYLALIEGAKGIWWYSMRDPGWDLTKTPLWPHMKEINAEIKSLSDPLMLGDNVPLQINNPTVHARAIKYQDKLYVLVTNPTDGASEVSLGFSGVPQVNEGVFLDGKGKVKVEHSTGAPNTLSLKLGALQSDTLVFDLPRK